VHAAGPSRGATNLRDDVHRCGPFARSIPGVQLFQANASLTRCLHEMLPPGVAQRDCVLS